MKVVPLRLQPGADLRRALEAWMGEQEEQAGCVLSAVGSLSLAQVRLAGATVATASWRSSASPAPSRPMVPTCISPSQAAAAL
jgi:predicted DNA-binding protein with PD1-like motif